MPRLLAPQPPAVLHHLLVDVLVPHGGFHVADPRRLQGLVQPEVGHDGGDHRVGQQLAPLLHIRAVQVHDLVAVHQLPPLVHGEAAVGVPVEGKARIAAVLLHVPTQPVHVGGARVQVDVQPVGAVIDHVYVRP